MRETFETVLVATWHSLRRAVRACARAYTRERAARCTTPFAALTSVMARLLLAVLVSCCCAVKEHDFRKCGDTPFCLTHRKLPAHGWHVNSSSVHVAEGLLRAQLVPPASNQLPLLLTLSVLRTGAVRVNIQDDPSLPLSALEGAD